MKVLVISDTHGTSNNEFLRSLILKYSPDVLFHLGDRVKDIAPLEQDFTNTRFIFARGNNDLVSPINLSATITLDNKKIFFTHGHTFYVKQTLNYVINAAKTQNADILLFGHTHIQYVQMHENMLVLNPGAFYYNNYIYFNTDNLTSLVKG